MKQSLVEIFSEIGHFGSDIGCNDKNGSHSYLETYDKLFAPFRDGCNLLEIGLAMGDSLKLWDRYFTNSTICGVDISVVFDTTPYHNLINTNVVVVIEADATKPEFIDYISSTTFDIIIDDGSHMTADQIAAFDILKYSMRKGGIYIIEDILALDIEREKYLSLHDNCEIIDMRHINNRFDNVLIVYKF